MYRFYRYKSSRPHYNPKNIYYVCSSGGSGSQALCHYLGHFGDVYHLHSRNPPTRLTTTGYDDQINTTNAEWFSNIEIPNEEIYKYKVIYLYRNPIDCIYSRLTNEDHLINIQCENPKATISDCIEQKADLFGIDNFFTNYTTINSERNYNIYCVKYEDLWTNMQKFNLFLFIPDIKDLYPEKRRQIKKCLATKILKKFMNHL